MEEKLKKALKVSKEGIWMVLALIIALNVLCAISTKDFVAYFEKCWVSLIYALALVTGLVLYKEGKNKKGAELVQWAALGSMFVYFVKFITLFISTGLVHFNIVEFLVELIVPVILIVEALRVIRMSENTERSLGTIILPIVVIALICVIQVINIVMPLITISSISIS